MQVTVYSDGSILKPNPGGPGGFGVAIVKGIGDVKRPVDFDDLLLDLGGKEHSTTNQRMELLGAIHGIDAAIKLGATEIELVSDSEYVIKGLSTWLPGWVRRNWRTASGTEVKNLDLWQRLADLIQTYGIGWHYTNVRGHRGIPWNEYCDVLAGEMSAEARREKSEALLAA